MSVEVGARACINAAPSYTVEIAIVSVSSLVFAERRSQLAPFKFSACGVHDSNTAVRQLVPSTNNRRESMGAIKSLIGEVRGSDSACATRRSKKGSCSEDSA